MKTVVMLGRWVTALVVVDGLSAVLCVLIAVPFAAFVGGSKGYFFAVGAITVVFSALGIAITAAHYSPSVSWPYMASREFVRQITLPMESNWLSRQLATRRILRQPLFASGIFVLSSLYMGGIITMVFREKVAGSKREKFFWPLLFLSCTAYALKLGFTYAGATFGGFWLWSKWF